MAIHKALFLATALAAVIALAGFAQSESNPDASGASATITRIERDWFDAMKADNTAKLTEIIADDWVDLNPEGVKLTKAEELNSFKSGESRLYSYEIGPVEVKVIGPVAVIQGSDIEKSTYKGKDTSGKWVWMDVFVKRDGKWQAVRSQTARVSNRGTNS